MRTRTLVLLMLLFAIAQLDRQILGMSLNAIGAEFLLSDTQLGLLSGLAFSLVFVAFGFPIAHIATHGNRRNIVSLSCLFWSCCTIVMGGAQNFVQLVLARMGIALGEAGAMAPAHSMIADLYPEHKRTSALATFATGGNIGLLLALLIGGIAGQYLGWRWAFVIAGIPGIAVALFLRFGIDEPPRQTSVNSSQGNDKIFQRTFVAIFSNADMRNLFLAFTLTGVVVLGNLSWIPAFLARQHDMGNAQIGIYLAAVIGVGGGLATFFSGRLADHLAIKHPHARLSLVVYQGVISIPLSVAFLLIPNTGLALAMHSVVLITGGVFWAPIFAHLYSLIDAKLRTVATVVFLFGFNLVGGAIGPSFVGIANDVFFFDQDAIGLGYSLLLLQVVSAISIWFAWRVKCSVQAGRHHSVNAPAE